MKTLIHDVKRRVDWTVSDTAMLKLLCPAPAGTRYVHAVLWYATSCCRAPLWEIEESWEIGKWRWAVGGGRVVRRET
jgi:hypothetical protein